jgi:hypothetical protein
MPDDDFARFCELVETDEELQRELWPMTEPEPFVAAVVRLGAARGFAIVPGRVWQALSEGRQTWMGIWAP